MSTGQEMRARLHGTLVWLWQEYGGEPLVIDPAEYGIGALIAVVLALGVVGYILYVFMRNK